MKYRRLGESTLEVSEIGFGCMSLGLTNRKEDSKLLRLAFEKGINYFDTANLYNGGENEKLVGNALKDIRDQVVISTKVGNQLRKDGSGWDWNPAKEYILHEVNNSLKRLQTDYIDLYMLHGGTIDDPIYETIEAFEILKSEGKIKEYGISSIRPNVIREWAKHSTIKTCMMQYSLLDRRPEESCIKILKENNISMLARGVLARGILVDKPANDYLSLRRDEVIKIKDRVKNLELDPVDASINYVLKNEVVGSAVIGIRNLAQLNSITNYQNIDVPASVFDDITPPIYTQHR